MAGKWYEIHIQGHLSQDWANWLDCMQMCYGENGEMILSGCLSDQAALLGVLNKLNGLNLCIVSVHQAGRDHTDPKACRGP